MSPLLPPAFGHPRAGRRGRGPRSPILGTVADLVAFPDDTRVALTWSQPVGGFSFQVQYKLSVDEDWIDFGNVELYPHSGATVVNLTNGAGYDFQVVSRDAFTSTTSNEDSATPAAPSPAFLTITTGPTITVEADTTMSAEFTQCDDGTGNPAKYVGRILSPTITEDTWYLGFESEVNIDTALEIGVAKTIQFTGLIPGTAYGIMVLPYRGTLGQGPTFGTFSTVDTGATTGSVALGTISNLAATPGSTSVGLTWTPAENATAHQPKYKLASSGTWLDFGAALGASASSVTVTGLTDDEEYDFKIEATDGSTTTDSNEVSTTPTTGDPTEPIFGGGDTVRMYDDFEVFTDTADLLTNGSHYTGRWVKKNIGSAIALRTSGAGEGSKCARFTYPATSTQQDILLEAGSIPGAAGAAVIATWLMRFQSGYVFTNTGTGYFGNTHKIMNMNIGGGATNSRLLVSIGQEAAVPSFALRLGISPHLAVGAYAWPQNLNFGTGAGQFKISASGTTTTRTTTVRFNGAVLNEEWLRWTLRLTPSPTNYNHATTSAPTANAKGRVELWITNISTAVTIKIIDWNGNDASKAEFGYVNIPYNISLVPNLHFPSVCNCRPPSAQWMEFDAVRVWRDN